MRKILLLLFSLSTITSLAQNHNANNVDKLISDKSFAFISTSSFSDKSQKSYNPHRTYYADEISTMPFPNYQGKLSVPFLTERMLLVETVPSMANTLPKNKTADVPLIFINDKNAFINHAALVPKFYELLGADPSDLTSPIAYSNYSVKQLKNGKIKVRFNFEDEGTERQVFLTVLPNGVSDLTLSSKPVRNDGWERTYFKGYITGNLD